MAMPTARLAMMASAGVRCLTTSSGTTGLVGPLFHPHGSDQDSHRRA